MERLRDCEPALHEAVQADQALNTDVTQCTGQAPCEHERVSSRYGHT
jgi:hypothetical protein